MTAHIGEDSAESNRPPNAVALGWQRCHFCGKTWIYGHSRERDPDIKSLFYTRSDGVKGSSYPMCAEHRPEQIRRLERMGFYDIEEHVA